MTKEDLIKKAKELKTQEAKQIAAAKEFVPAKYRSFIQLLDENIKLADFAFAPEFDEMAELGIFTIAPKKQGEFGKTMLRTKKPYFPVDGRVVWFNDEHKKSGEEGGRYKYSVKSNIAQLNDHIMGGGLLPKNAQLMVEIESELFGNLEGNATIFTADYGVNNTNPLENGYTSALGRCIGGTGIGVLPGAGLASAEEVILAKEVQKASKRKSGKSNVVAESTEDSGSTSEPEETPAKEVSQVGAPTEGEPEVGQPVKTPNGEPETSAQEPSTEAEEITDAQGDNQTPDPGQPESGSGVNAEGSKVSSGGISDDAQSETTWKFLMVEEAVVGTTPGHKKRPFGGGRAVDYPNSEKVFKLISWDKEAELFMGVKENNLIEVTGVKGYSQKPGGAGEHTFTVKTLKNHGPVTNEQMAS